MKNGSKVAQVVIGLVVLMLAACMPITDDGGAAMPEAEAEAPMISFLNGRWDVSELTVGGESVSLPENAGAFLLINDDQVSGSTGCNSFTGSATFNQGSVTFGPLATTRKACPEAAMTFESALLNALGSVTTYAGGRTSLSLSNDDGTTLIELTPQAAADAVAPQASFLDGKWSFNEVSVDGETLQAPYAASAYLAIDGDQVSGSTGCNSFSGTATFDAGAVTFDSLAITERACTDSNVMAFEAALLDVLNSAAAYDAGGSDLVISNEDGSKSADLTFVEVKTFFVGPEQAECSAGAGLRQCLMVKENPDDDYTFFYDNIDGFEWEEGYDYELLVEVFNVANPPADASSLRYELVEVVSKTTVQ